MKLSIAQAFNLMFQTASGLATRLLGGTDAWLARGLNLQLTPQPNLERRRLTMRITTFIILLAAAMIAAPAMAEKYELDTAHSNFTFSVRHLTISNVKGSFKDFSATIDFDEADVTKTRVSVNIQAASIDTANTKRDDHLRTPDFFEVEKYPAITFQTKRVEKRGDGFVAIGDFTMRGVTKEIEVPFTVTGPINDPWGNKRVGFDGGLKINRQDYNIAYDKTGLTVGNDVKIEFSLQGIQKK